MSYSCNKRSFGGFETLYEYRVHRAKLHGETATFPTTLQEKIDAGFIDYLENKLLSLETRLVALEEKKK